MDSPFANIFLAMQQRIQSQVSDIAYINQDLGQLKASRPPVSWPCLLIDFEDFSFDNLAENVQTAKGIVVIKLGFAPHSPSAQATPTAYLQQAIGYYDIEWTLHKAMQGWSPGADFGALSRAAASTLSRSDGYRVRELRYSLAFEDYSTKWQQQYAPATLVTNDEMGV